MSLIGAARAEGSPDVLATLTRVADAQGQGSLARRLAELGELVRWDMRAVEEALDELPPAADVVRKSAHHLIARGGKLLLVRLTVAVRISARSARPKSPR